MGDLTPFAESVLGVVDRIPPGKVMTYGDVREWLGTSSARAVGAVMARYGGETAWHRVVLSTGAPAPGHEAEALRLLRAERTPLNRGGDRVDLARARWDGR